jgi:hypothetical protein
MSRREGGMEISGGQLIPDKGAEWMGIRHHEQDIGLPSKWGVFPFLQTRVCAQIIDYMLWKYKYRISVCRLKINHAWSTKSCN